MRLLLVALVAAAVSILAACSGADQAAAPPECAGVYRLQIEKTVYLVSPGGGVAPEHCRRYAISLEEHLAKQPLPAGYVNCRTKEGKIVGMKPAMCERDGGTSLD